MSDKYYYFYSENEAVAGRKFRTEEEAWEWWETIGRRMGIFPIVLTADHNLPNPCGIR